MKHFGVVLCASLATLALVACAEGDDNKGSGGDTPNCTDLDGDGESAISPACATGKDCNDRDAKINTRATEIPDNQVDENCDNIKAQSPSDCTRTVDADGDGYYKQELQNTANAPRNCKGVDCLDTDRNVYPGGPGGRGEIANNGKDDDCNPATPDEVPDCKDDDKDGWGIQGKNQCPNRLPADFDKFDCNDADDDVYPGATEICDGKDNDCDDTGDGKGVDECLDAQGQPADNMQCGSQRALCLGRLKAPCNENRDCDVEAGYACEGGKCLLFGDNAAERCFDNTDCVTGTCDVQSGKCSTYCDAPATNCGSQNVCGEAIPRLCDEEQRCHDCVDSSELGACSCGLCAGYKCFDGPYFTTIADEDAEAGTGPPLLQVISALSDCFANKGGDATLCTSFNTTGLTQAVSEGQIDDFICDGDHPGIDGAAYDTANDMVGCGLFNIDELEMKAAVSPGEFYLTCAWWDGADVKVDNCEDFPANR